MNVWIDVAVCSMMFAVGSIGTLVAAAAVVHVWWLPRHGINPWTGEPKEKYYALRGWKV